MQSLLGWTILMLGGFLYLAQLISSINFELAQKLGIQEAPGETDTIVKTAEQYVAYWDLVTLGWVPIAGLLMIIDHHWWQIIALIGGAIYFDTSGREAAKFLSLKKEGIKLGTIKQQQMFFSSYIAMAVVGLFVMIYSLSNILI